MELICLVVFIFCAALAAGGILMVSQMTLKHPAPFVRSLIYYTIFICAFCFYGIWGQFIIVGIAGDKLTPDLMSSISVVSFLLGLPFLVFAWLMLTRLGSEIAGYLFNNYLTAIFLIVNFGVILLLGISTRNTEFSEALPIFRSYYCCSVIVYSLITSLLLLKAKATELSKTDRRNVTVIIISGALLQVAVLLLIPDPVWMALIFVFLLIASTMMLPVYLTYIADLHVCQPLPGLQLPKGIEDFFITHEISPREAEIIKEICNGLSNQEIADKLFISLQTVKDHTSRIYSKANVRNRMQLMTLVQTIDN